MALQGPNGEYLRIEVISIDSNYIATVQYRIYLNQEHRLSGDTQFLTSQMGVVNSGALQVALAGLPNPALSIINNLKAESYNAIKADTFEISSWIDC